MLLLWDGVTFCSSLRAAAWFLSSASQNGNTNTEAILPSHNRRASDELLLFVVTITEVVGVGHWMLAKLVLPFRSHLKDDEGYNISAACAVLVGANATCRFP